MRLDNFVAQIAKVVVFIVILAASSQAYALTFANGGFEGYTGNTNIHNSGTPPGWTTTGGTPDTFDANTNFAGYTWGSSTNGGQFLHGIGIQPYNESAQQLALDGLVIGQKYEISFEQAISRSQWSRGGGYWSITFGTEVQDSPHMNIPDYGVFTGWDWVTMLFTATEVEQSLTVTAMASVPGVRADIGIDSFFLGEPGGNPDNPDNPVEPVPEPSTVLLLGSGLVGLAWYGRKRKKA